MIIIAMLRMFCQDIRDTIFPKRKLLKDLRAAWALPGSKEEPSADRYFELTRAQSISPCVDDRTWVDLEFPRIFLKMDTTLSAIGSQVLFKKMHTYDDVAHSFDAYGISQQLRMDASARERIQCKLAPLRDSSNANIADFVFGRAPQAMARRYRYLLLLWGLASVTALTAAITVSFPIWIWAAIVAVNVVTIRMMSWTVHRDAETMKACLVMLRVADSLKTEKTHELSLLRHLADQASQRANARQALGWMSKLQRPVVRDISVWLTLFFLLELIAYVYTVERFLSAQPILASTFELLGALDASIAVASYLEQFPQHCHPTIANHRIIEILEGYHPLIASPVTNSVSLEHRSALITGSNMAGKTTFIKMVAINHVLGHTLGFCLAERAALPDCEVMTSIRGDHSVDSGKSHYFVEIEAMHTFIDATGRDNPPIFVIDELFRGTNTQERVALARAVLENLSKYSLVLVTTHDVELQPVLKDHYQLYHFQENPDVKGFFDYRLKLGESSERNAIRLFQRMDFPASVVADAIRYAADTQAVF